jgi:NitT/TauT family transport system substrate-binding protein
MNLSKNFLVRSIAILCLVIGLTSCSLNQTVTAKEPLRVEYTLWWGDYTLLVAQEQGLFEKYGISVEPVFYEAYSDSYSDLAAGIIDGGLFSLDNAIDTNDKSPIKAVAIYDDGGIFYFIGNEDVRNISDLKGKKVGVEIGSSGELLLTEALAKGGLTLNDITLMDATVESIPNMLGSSIDAGLVWEPYASEARAKGGNILFQSGGAKTITPDLIVFNANTLQSRPEDIRAFLKAWFEAVDFRNANPQEANQIISAKTGQSIDKITEDSRIYTLQENIVLFSDQTPENMINLKTAFNTNVDFLLRLGVLRNQPDINQFIDSSFLFQ